MQIEKDVLLHQLDNELIQTTTSCFYLTPSLLAFVSARLTAVSCCVVPAIVMVGGGNELSMHYFIFSN